MEAFKIVFVILAVIQGFNCFSFGNITAESKLIHQGYYNGTAKEYEITLRQETINTNQTISAMRAVDVSGQNGTTVMSLFNSRSVTLVFSSAAINKGFNISLEIYSNEMSGGANPKSVPLISMIIGVAVALLRFAKV
ncbi:hypothetical protein Bhyg_17489 [Pseudolycoriella hygida]|uniref:Uncharacterized protein n=1 Tax=Pseudolycoriella hygida TaxID=35572 RepID=A0A9Q0MHD8_9DIPT|nr:hypothetical protein Bhyg_17489 [Pseudolycoriella hygida]